MSDYPRWRKALAKANDAEFWPITAIDAMLAEGRAQFWAGERSALVTQIVAYPGGAEALEAIAGAGDKQEIMGPIAEAVTAWAKSNGITHMKVKGRAGWSRAMKPHGWRHFQDTIIKDIR